MVTKYTICAAPAPVSPSVETSVEDSALSKFGAAMVVLKAMIIVLQNSLTPKLC